MKEYRKDIPLIYCHIPKMGGVSVRDIFHRAFGENLFLHYNKPILRDNLLVGIKPGQIQWAGLLELSRVKPVCIYGHFRQTERTGTDDFYPEATQFAVVLRDPLQAAVSSYFFSRRKIDEGVPIPMRFKSVNEFLEHNRSQIFNHLPVAARANPSDFIENQLVMSATLDDMRGLTYFMKRNFSLEVAIPHLNESDRGEEIDPAVVKRWTFRNEEELSFFKLLQESMGDFK